MKTICLCLLVLSASCAPVRVSQPRLDWKKTLEPSCWPYEQVREGDETFFSVRCRATATASLWRYAAGMEVPRKVADVPYSAWHLRAMDGAVYFGATDKEHGFELWKAVPDEKRAFMLADLHPTAGSNPWNIGVAGKRMLMVAHHAEHGRSFFVTDGIPEGTVFLKPLSDRQSLPFFLERTPERLRFFTRHRTRDRGVRGTAFKLHRLVFWESDGTAAGTRETHDVRIKEHREEFKQPLAMGGRLFWLHVGPSGRSTSLWVSDGTDAGTREIRAFASHQGRPESLAAAGGKLFVTLRTYEGFQLWAGDEKSGVALVREWTFPERKGWGDPKPVERLVSSCDRLFFSARTGEKGGLELWTSDGSPQGTQVILAERNKLLDIRNPRNFYGPHCALGSHFLWVENREAASGRATPGKLRVVELIVTDGSPDNTHLVWHWER